VPSVGHTLQISATAENVQVPERENRVNYEYYHGEWNLLPDFSALTPIETGQAAYFSLDTRQQEDNYAYRYSATLALTAAGSYSFFTISGDGSQLFVNGELVGRAQSVCQPDSMRWW